MFGITNWQTTLGGIATILTSLGTGVHALSSGDVNTALSNIPAVLAGLALIAAKDKNVTGGTVAATVEAQRRTDSPAVK